MAMTAHSIEALEDTIVPMIRKHIEDAGDLSQEDELHEAIFLEWRGVYAYALRRLAEHSDRMARLYDDRT